MKILIVLTILGNIAFAEPLAPIDEDAKLGQDASIREKREPKYQVLESNGLASHFRPNNVNPFKTIFMQPLSQKEPFKGAYMQNIAYNKLRPPTPKEANVEIPSVRKARSVENETDGAAEKITNPNEGLPDPEKQIMGTSRFYPEARASSIIGKWARPFEYSKIQHEEGLMIDDSLLSNEGISARTPRVNFITQQKKIERQTDPKSSVNKPEIYRNAEEDRNESERSLERAPPRNLYPSSFTYRERDIVPEKYIPRYHK